MNIPENANKIIHKLQENGYEAFLVGGCVRDAMLQRTPHDYDIVTSATPDQIMDVFKEYHKVTTGLHFGTVNVVIGSDIYDVTTYRIDGTYDGRRPDSITHANTIEEDLQRRDFTINAMAYNEKDGLVDLFDGKTDLENKIIRCVGDPKKRFHEDVLRILRMYRFCVQLGFSPEEQTRNVAEEMIKEDCLKKISAERIQKEFVCALRSDKQNFSKLPDCFLESIIPEWKNTVMDQHNVYHIYNVREHSLEAYRQLQDDDEDLILRLATLLHDIGKPSCYTIDEKGYKHFKGHGKVSATMVDDILHRMKFETVVIKKVVELIYYHDTTFEVTKKSVLRWLNKIGEQQFSRLLKLRRADILAQNPKFSRPRLDKIDRMEAMLEMVIMENDCFSLSDLAINGKDVMAVLQIKGGKEVGNCLNEVLNKVINGELNNNKTEIIQFLKERMKNGKS